MATNGSANFNIIYSPSQSKSPVNPTVKTASEVTGGYVRGYLVLASTATGPAPHERTAAKLNSAGRKRLHVSEVWREAEESTVLIAMAQEHEEDAVFGNIEGYVKLRVDIGEYGHYLDSRADHGSNSPDNIRLEEPYEIITAGTYNLKGSPQESSVATSPTRLELGSK